MLLKLNNIYKYYQINKDEKQTALDDINLEFNNGEFVSILGPSGSGKSTLLNILSGLDTPSSGSLIIDGQDTINFNEKDWDFYRKNNIGIIFQNYNLIEHLTALENVELAMTLTGIKKKQRLERAKKLLLDVGLNSDQINHLPNQLSGGQKQRVAIARSLANDPDIILADEPTGALDKKTGILIMELIKKIAKDKLVIMVTHNKKLADEYSTRIVSLKDGKIESDQIIINEDVKQEKSILNKKNKTMPFFEALKISFRNMKKKMGRVILTIIAGCIGIAGISLVLGLGNGANIFIDNQIVKFGNSNVLSVSMSKKEKNGDIKQLDKLKDFDFIKQNKDVVEIRPSLKNMGNYLYDKEVLDAQVAALAPSKQQQFLKDFLIGNLPKENSNQILINKSLARNIMSIDNIKDQESNYEKVLNKKVTLNLESNNIPVSKTFKVAGIIDEIDVGISYLYYDYDFMKNFYQDTPIYNQTLYDLSKKDNPKFEVVIDNAKKASNVKNWIIEKSGLKDAGMDIFMGSSEGISVHNFALTFKQAFTTIINIAQIVMIAFLILALIVSSILIAIVLFSSILERKVEIGILKAIGSRKKDIIRVFESEAMLLGFSAGCLGIIISFALVPLAEVIVNNFVDYDISGIIKIPLSGQIFGVTIPLLPIIVLIFISTLVAFIAGYIPSRKATKMAVVDALRDE